VVTKPAELISSNGKPEYTPVSGTGLLYMSNTDSDVLLEIKTQMHYVLLSGRWFASPKLAGPWKHLPGEKLPPDFAKIPQDSEANTVLYAVPHTQAAEDAVLDAHIPQTGAINRKETTLEVQYDGAPKFESIPETRLSYAVNTNTPVIRAQGKYYACGDAVWFVAATPKGPWQVAIRIPKEIYTITPECPIYNVTYVRIYSYTPEVVYVGYTAGYTGTYIYHRTIVYGTGYRYPAWYGRYYYPRPATWGFHVRWNSWTGWGFGFSYSSGPFYFGVGAGGWYRGGWWGPGHWRSYRRGYRHGYRHGYRAGRISARRRAYHRNLYRRKKRPPRPSHPIARPPRKTRPPAKARPPAKGRPPAKARRPNNVYTNKKGEVYRRNNQGWQKRSGNNWQTQRPSRTPTNRDNTRQLNRNHNARQRGNSRTNQFRRSRSGGPGRRP
jgi:hypothetical protein